MKASDDIMSLKGIGEKTAKLFHKVGIYEIWQLIEYYPRDYQSFSKPVHLRDAKDGEEITAMLTLTTDFSFRKVKNFTLGTGKATDGEDLITLTYFNAPFLKSKLKKGCSYLFRGKLRRQKEQFHMDQPQIFTCEEYEAKMDHLQPCYRLTKGLTDHMVEKAVKQAFSYYDTEEFLPERLRQEYKLLSPAEARWKIHFPKSMEEMLKARNRLVFEEFFLFLIQIRQMKDYNDALETEYPMIETALPERVIEALPYQLTSAQQRVWQEIKQDLTSGKCMNRLIQGDVGSGKTILAFLALLLTVTNGYQGAMMAPTEILATQHFEQLCELTRKYDLPLKPVLLTGSLGSAAKKEVYAQIEQGKVNVIIGTHALIQEKVMYQKLGLVITDEQHRFGVRQREILGEKGGAAHVLVMSATPIPRTLAIILYGDLHLSAVDELPAGRMPIKNCVVGTSYRPKAYTFIFDQVRLGRQAYVICPMVEPSENDTLELQNVEDYGKMLRTKLPKDIRVEILHGKMKAADKKRIMEAFGRGDIDVLVSTTVIEVGINVPNATVVMVENAERFGLAQLHQLRGRIGRGKEQSYCIFINCSEKKQSQDRLQILNRSNDGFRIAEEDLKLRGPGDLFGIRQSGAMEFKVADIYQDAGLLSKISSLVDELLSQDHELEQAENEALKNYLSEQGKRKLIDFRSI